LLAGEPEGSHHERSLRARGIVAIASRAHDLRVRKNGRVEPDGLLGAVVERQECRDLLHFGSPQDFAAIRSRSRFSDSRILPVGSRAANSWFSKIGRISTSPSGRGARFNHPIASCSDLTFQIQNPATSSLVSGNGPSMTVVVRPPKRTRAPFEL